MPIRCARCEGHAGRSHHARCPKVAEANDRRGVYAAPPYKLLPSPRLLHIEVSLDELRLIVSPNPASPSEARVTRMIDGLPVKVHRDFLWNAGKYAPVELNVAAAERLWRQRWVLAEVAWWHIEGKLPRGHKMAEAVIITLSEHI